jgi:hypothetical protein
MNYTPIGVNKASVLGVLAAGNAAVVYTAVDTSDTKIPSDTINSPR